MPKKKSCFQFATKFRVDANSSHLSLWGKITCRSLCRIQDQQFILVVNKTYSRLVGGITTLQWRHNGRGDVSNYQHLECLFNSLFRRRSQKISKLPVTDLCDGNSPVTGEFPSQRASNAENVSIWWRHHGSTLNPVTINKLSICRKYTDKGFTA